MDMVSNVAIKQSRRTRSVRFSAPMVMLAVLMVAGAFMPFAAAAPAPDLVVDEANISITPTSLVVGVTANITFTVENIAEQNAFSFNISLWDHGSQVGQIVDEDLLIGMPAAYSFLWAPRYEGTYDLRIQAWYGPYSAKQDMNWEDNNGTISVDVKSRPDIQVTDGDLSYDAAPDPDYVTDGDIVTLNAVLHNLGSADVTSCSVAIWEASVGPMENFIGMVSGIAVPGLGQTPVTYEWNTTSWSGKRTIIFNVSDVAPFETVLDNNMASIAIKIHTKEDLVFVGVDTAKIDTDYKIQNFITIKDDAKLSIVEGGNATMFQDFNDQYDIVVMDNGVLEITRGILSSELNFTIFLSGNAKLLVSDGANVSFRVIGTGGSSISISDSYMDAPSVGLESGALTIINSTIIVDNIFTADTELTIRNSTLILGSQFVISGQYTQIWDTEVRVIRNFESYSDAVVIYPVLEFYDVETHQVDGLDPAIHAMSGARVDLYNVSVESLVIVKGEGDEFWTENRLGVSGRTSVINIFRYLMVEVRDWSYQPIEGA